MDSSSSRYASRCSVCGKPARVHMGATAYCLDCYNHITDYLAEVETPTNDDYSILALDSKGRAVEFAVERFSFGSSSTWTAIEQVPDDDPRRKWGYVGRSVSIVADARLMSQEEALDALMVKVQRITEHASTRGTRIEAGQIWNSSAYCEGEVLYANETGVARVDCDENGKPSVVVDGQSFTPTQFAEMMSCFEGFDLYWQIRDASDKPPEWL